MIDGRQKCESTGTSNKRLAQKILDKRKGEIAEGRFSLPKSNPPTLKQWADQFLESIAHLNTKRVYGSCIRVLLGFLERRVSRRSVPVASRNSSSHGREPGQGTQQSIGISLCSDG